MYRESCFFSSDYSAELGTLSDPAKLAELDVAHQFPFTQVVAEEKTEEELERIAEKKRENGRRLQEMQQKQRLDKVRRRFVFLELLVTSIECRC
jgi:actin-related protein 5